MLISVTPYYKIKVKKYLPSLNTLIAVLCIIIFAYGLYSISGHNKNEDGSMMQKDLSEPYYKAIHKSYLTAKSEMRDRKDEEFTFPAVSFTINTPAIDTYHPVDPVKDWQKHGQSKAVDLWTVTTSVPDYTRQKRAGKPKPSKVIVMRHFSRNLPHSSIHSDSNRGTSTNITKEKQPRKLTRQPKKIHSKGTTIPRTKKTTKKKVQQKYGLHRRRKTIPKPNLPPPKSKDRRDIMDIRVTKRVCPMQRPHKADIQTLSMLEKLDFIPYDGNNFYKFEWNQPFSPDSAKDWRNNAKLKVILVPHSHLDPGWRTTFETYYESLVRNLFKNLLVKLSEEPTRKFILAEISFLERWWNKDATKIQKETFKKLLNSGQLEIVTGGWVMNDEANSHWTATAAQLAAGQQWLLAALRYRPRSAWAVDPFGHSAAQPYLLRRAGLARSVVQRVHYRLKKELALQRQLEFRWRQLWDGTGQTDMLTHILAFGGYDTAATCGPDTSLCCQFDFRTVTCPSFIYSLSNLTTDEISRSLVRVTATLVDQWRKKAELFRSNVIMVPLGADFAYTRDSEWDSQFNAYEMFNEYINHHPQLNTEVKFGTLHDYFEALEQVTSPRGFPVLSGDFFTYADIWNHYWSGYYTTRPFYKSMDRVALAYLRAAEIIAAQASCPRVMSPAMTARLAERVESARRALVLFQHHDAITGTSTRQVVADYGKRLLAAILESQTVIKQATYFLMQQPLTTKDTKIKSKFKSTKDIYFEMDELWRHSTALPQRLAVILTNQTPIQRVVVYNALAFHRMEFITVIVNTPRVEVYDSDGAKVVTQVSPVVAADGEDRLTFVAHRYRATFYASLDMLSLSTYTFMLARKPKKWNVKYATVQTYNLESVSIDDVFTTHESDNPPPADLTLRAGNSTQFVVSPQGLLRAVIEGKTTTKLDMSFVQYTTRPRQRQSHSGAYVFIPLGPAQPFQTESSSPDMVVVVGPLVTTVYTTLIGNDARINLAISVSNNWSLQQSELEVSCTVKLDPRAGDIELALQLATIIHNEDVFYTDLNGVQMIKRRTFSKLPIQGNWYPLGGAAYIQDDSQRLTLLSATPLGVAALQPGQLKVMLDRRLTRDDGRGLGEAVTDNLPTRHTFRLIVERANYLCEAGSTNLYGQLTLGAHISQQTLLQPLVLLHYTPPHQTWPAPTYSDAYLLASDVVLASFRTDVFGMMANGTVLRGMGMTFQRVHLDSCYGNKDIANFYPVGAGQVKVSRVAKIDPQQVYESSLTFTSVGERLHDATLFLCPMEISSVFINNP